MNTACWSAITCISILVVASCLRPILWVHASDSLKNMQDQYDTSMGPPLPPPEAELPGPAVPPRTTLTRSSEELVAAVNDLAFNTTILERAGANITRDARGLATKYQTLMGRLDREIALTNDPWLRRAQTQLTTQLARDQERCRKESQTAVAQVRMAVQHAADLEHAQHTLSLATQLSEEQTAFWASVARVRLAAQHLTTRSQALLGQVAEHLKRRAARPTNGI